MHNKVCNCTGNTCNFLEHITGAFRETKTEVLFNPNEFMYEVNLIWRAFFTVMRRCADTSG